MTLRFLLDEAEKGEDAPVVIVPVPLEKTTTYLKGTRNGPTALLKASEQLEIYDYLSAMQTARVGLHTAQAIDCRSHLDECVKAIYKSAYSWWKKKKFPVFLGGEHSLSIGVFKALKERHGPGNIVQIDAHADLRDSYHGSKNNHACVMSRALDEGHRLFQIGIRALSEREHETINNHSKITTWFDGDSTWKQQLPTLLEESPGPVYLTVDVDGISPTLMAATGTPVPGGLSWQDVNEVIALTANTGRLVGADVNELKPSKELRVCDFTAAHIVYRILGAQAKACQWPFLLDAFEEE